MIFVRCPILKSLKCVDTAYGDITVDELISRISSETGVPRDMLLAHNGCKQLLPTSVVPHGTTVYFTFSVLGGKGGFGSMLRAIGAQIEKTTNREACRDLSGRRLRDINEEQRLKKWLAKKVEREAEAERRHRERLLRLKEEPKHDFNDPEYSKIRSELPERIDDALSEGLKKKQQNPGKKHLEETAGPSSKKPCLWLDVDVSSDSDCEERASSEKDIQSSNEDSTSSKDDCNKEMCTLQSEESTSDSANLSQNPEHSADSNVLDIPEMKKEEQLLDGKPIEEENSMKKSEEGNPDKDINTQNLMALKNVQEVEELGLEKLKEILKQLGLKCGGTLSERAQRLWAVRGLDPKDFPASLRAKVSQKAVSS